VKNSRSQSGFGLIEILIVGFLTAISSLMINRMLSNSLAGTKAVQAKTDIESLTTTLKLILGNEAQCPTSLQNSRPSPTTAYFNPGGSLPAADELHAVVQGGARIAELNQSFPTFKINELILSEIDPSARVITPTTTRYIVKLKIKVTKSGASASGVFFSGELREEIPIWVETNNTTHQITACGTSSEGKSFLKTADITYTKFIGAPGVCDPASSPAGECYCGGLETVHRATTSNPTGSPYDHVNPPAHNERPRRWQGEIECPAGYVLGGVGAKCPSISGKLENIDILSPSKAYVSCCAYTADSVPNPSTQPGIITGVCYKL